MFSVHCPRHGHEVLLTEGRISGIHNTRGGVVVDWTCWCGQRGATRTGRSRPSAPTAIG